MQRLLDHLRVAYLTFVAIVTIVAGWYCLDLTVDRENRSMEAEDAGLTEVEAEFDRLFHENDSILVAVKRTDLLSPDGQAMIGELVSAFARIDGVSGVSSLVETGFLILPFHEGLLISEDRETTGIAIRLKEFDDNGASLERIIVEIRKIAGSKSQPGSRIAVTGLPVQKYESARLVLRDQKIFSPLSFLVLGTVLFIITRRLAGTLIPLLIAAITISWTIGLYAFLDLPLNMITSLLPPVIVSISVATTIHIYLEWAGSDEGEGNPRIVAAIRKLNPPCLFAAVTTVIGFLSLLLSHTPAVRTFGLFAALGVGIGYVLGTSFLAVCLSYLKPKRSHLSPTPLGSLIEWIAPIPIRHPRLVVATALVLAVIGAIGVGLVKNNTDLLRFLDTENHLVEDTLFVEEELTGTNAVEILVTRADGSAFTGNGGMLKIAAFQKQLCELPRVRHTLSPVDLMAAPGQANPLLSEDYRTIRLTVRTDSIGTAEGADLLTSIRDEAKRELGDEFEIHEAGDFNRVIVESNQLASSQVRSFGVAIVLILLSIGIVFRSALYMSLAILPNVTPLLMTAAIMGFAKIDLSTGTAMIASVVIGLAVDDTIHYLSAFRQAFTGDCDAALMATTRSSGFAIIAATMTLSAGFWVAVFGSFQPTVYFALLSGLTMWFALAFDILVLPACLKLVFGRSPIPSS